jgi:hypothetical protein
MTDPQPTKTKPLHISKKIYFLHERKPFFQKKVFEREKNPQPVKLVYTCIDYHNISLGILVTVRLRFKKNSTT